MKKIAILASGSGSNFEAIVHAQRRKKFNAQIALLICDKENAFCRTRAKRLKIKDIFIDPKNYISRESFDAAMTKILQDEKIDLVVLAGYMRILSPGFIRTFKNKVINIHPALLPAFKGGQAVKDALDYGVKLTGVTVHFADEKVDHGPIILQGAVAIGNGTTIKKLEDAVHKLEHKLYPEAIRLVLKNKVKIEGRHVQIK
jgi:phosphoribosylglycinamide formyltransferase-1